MGDVLKNRKREWVSDISFDLDGDGFVGNRDLVLSKLFDKDNDGKLNAEERQYALEAIKNVSLRFRHQDRQKCFDSMC